jgi:F-type H+-transporting ATPase subunit gamma
MAKQPGIAGYATLREIEDRLKSIRNIEKITKTMKIVASTKLTRAQRAMTESRTYGQTSQTVFDKAETKAAAEGEGKKTLLIVCSSDKGLCGGIHSGMSRLTRRMLIEHPDTDLAIVGEKCKAQLSRSNPRQMVISFAGIGRDIPSFTDAQAIADQVVQLPGDYTNVKVMYNRFNNASSFEPIVVEAYSEEAIKNSRTFRDEDGECDANGRSEPDQLRDRRRRAREPAGVRPRQLAVLGVGRGPRLRAGVEAERDGQRL